MTGFVQPRTWAEVDWFPMILFAIGPVLIVALFIFGGRGSSGKEVGRVTKTTDRMGNAAIHEQKRVAEARPAPAGGVK